MYTGNATSSNIVLGAFNFGSLLRRRCGGFVKWLCARNPSFAISIWMRRLSMRVKTRRRLCIIHKTYRAGGAAAGGSIQSSSIARRAQVVSRDYFQIDRTVSLVAEWPRGGPARQRRRRPFSACLEGVQVRPAGTYYTRMCLIRAR